MSISRHPFDDAIVSVSSMTQLYELPNKCHFPQERVIQHLMPLFQIVLTYLTMEVAELQSFIRMNLIHSSKETHLLDLVKARCKRMSMP